MSDVRREESRFAGRGRTGVRTTIWAFDAKVDKQVSYGHTDSRADEQATVSKTHLALDPPCRNLIFVAHKLDLHPERRRSDMILLIPPQPLRPGRRQPLHVKHVRGAEGREQDGVGERLRDGAPERGAEGFEPRLVECGRGGQEEGAESRQVGVFSEALVCVKTNRCMRAVSRQSQPTDFFRGDGTLPNKARSTQGRRLTQQRIPEGLLGEYALAQEAEFAVPRGPDDEARVAEHLGQDQRVQRFRELTCGRKEERRGRSRLCFQELGELFRVGFAAGGQGRERESGRVGDQVEREAEPVRGRRVVERQDRVFEGRFGRTRRDGEERPPRDQRSCQVLPGLKDAGGKSVSGAGPHSTDSQIGRTWFVNCRVCPSETIEMTTSEGSPAAAAPSFPSACKTLPLSSNSRASSSAEGPRTISTAAWLLRAPVSRPGDETVATRSSAGRESGVVSVPGPKTTGLYGLVASARVTRSASAHE